MAELMNFDSIMGRREDAAAAVEDATKKVTEKRSKSVRPLTFEHRPDDTPIKTEIVDKLNAKNYKYQDLLNYCCEIEEDSTKGLGLGNNIINCLRSRNNLSLTYLQILCGFLGLEIHLVEKAKDVDAGGT